MGMDTLLSAIGSEDVVILIAVFFSALIGFLVGVIAGKGRQ